MAGGIDDHEVIHCSIVFELLLEGIFDGRIVRVDELILNELNRQTRFAYEQDKEEEKEEADRYYTSNGTENENLKGRKVRRRREKKKKRRSKVEK